LTDFLKFLHCQVIVEPFQEVGARNTLVSGLYYFVQDSVLRGLQSILADATEDSVERLLALVQESKSQRQTGTINQTITTSSSRNAH
jgi:hypothetical protein